MRLHPRLAPAIHPGTLQDFSLTCRTPLDAILIDAPCSGTGVIRRHPEIRWNRQAADLPAYQQIQRQILEQASLLLAPEGTLVYATCSLEPEENDGVITEFLRRIRILRSRTAGLFCLSPPANW